MLFRLPACLGLARANVCETVRTGRPNDEHDEHLNVRPIGSVSSFWMIGYREREGKPERRGAGNQSRNPFRRVSSGVLLGFLLCRSGKLLVPILFRCLKELSTKTAPTHDQHERKPRSLRVAWCDDWSDDDDDDHKKDKCDDGSEGGTDMKCSTRYLLNKINEETLSLSPLFRHFSGLAGTGSRHRAPASATRRLEINADINRSNDCKSIKDDGRPTERCVLLASLPAGLEQWNTSRWTDSLMNDLWEVGSVAMCAPFRLLDALQARYYHD